MDNNDSIKTIKPVIMMRVIRVVKMMMTIITKKW